MSTTALDVSFKVLYVQGSVPAVDAATTEQLRTLASELQITTIAGSAAALAELRRTPGWQALLASPSLPQNEILALITSLRRDRIPIAIVPIVDETHQDLFASAVASGADDVLVRRGETLVNVSETVARIRQSPHLFPAEQRRRINVLYAGRDPLVWNLLDQVPFVKAERVSCGVDGACPVRRAGSSDNSLRADAVIIDEQPGEAHPLQVLKSVKAQASDLPVIMLTSAGAADIATAALELGADDTVLKTGIFRRRLIATLRRVHQRLELTAQQVETKTREERLRQIVENVPTGILVIAANGNVLAMNAAALQLFGANKPRDIVGRDFRDLVAAKDHEAITTLIRSVTRGEAGAATFDALTLTGGQVAAHLQAVVLERDARGGRGVVASVTVATQQLPATEGRSEELETLQDTLQRTERHYAELEEARANEQAAWDAERRQLEVRLQEAERLASERSTLEERLDEVTAELARTSQSFATERQSLEVRLQELEAAAREASAVGATKDELERALASLRDEQQQAIEAHALERAGWQDIRSELELRIRELGAAHENERESIVAELQSEVRLLQQTLTGERERWDTTREQLEAELRNAREALWAEHNQRDAARSDAESALTRLREEHGADAATWQTSREALERSAADMQAAVDEARAERERVRTALELELDSLRAALEAALANAQHSTDAARAEWTAARALLEQDVQQARAGIDEERATWHRRLAELEDDLRRAQNAEGAQRELTAVRSRLESELEETRQQVALERAAAEAIETRAHEEIERAQEAARAVTEEYDATRARLEQDARDARETLEREHAAWLEHRGRLESDLAGASNLAQVIQQRWEEERQQRENELQQAMESARLAWDETRAQLERDVHDARERENEWVQEVARLEQVVTDTTRRIEEERQAVATQHAEETRAYQQTIEALTQARDTLRSEQEEAQNRNAALWSELEAARVQLGDRDTLAATLAAVQAERDTFQQERDDARNRIDGLSHELDDLRRKADDRDALAAQLDAVQTDRNSFEQERDMFRGDRDEAHHRIAALSNELDDLRRRSEDRDALAAELDAVRSERNTVEQERDTLRAEHDDAHQRIGALHQELDDLRRRAEDRDALAAQLDAVHAECAHARNERDAVSRTRDDAYDRIAALSMELDEVRRHAGERDGFAARLDDTERDRDAMRHERDAALAQIAALTQEKDEAQRAAMERDQLATALDAARNELRHTDAAHHAEREGWERLRGALEHDVRQIRAERDSDRDAWTLARTQLETEAREAARAAAEQRRLEQALEALRADYAVLAESLSSEREQREQVRREADGLRQSVLETQARQSSFDAELERSARSADEQLAKQMALHDTRVRGLEAELQNLSQRLAAATRTAETTRTELGARHARAWEYHARLVASDLFGYAVTNLNGDLLRCNDAFARIFGYVNAGEALARVGGRPFQPLANRPDVTARLLATGRIDRIESCVDRIDGSAMRLIESAVVTGGDDDSSARVIEHIVTAGAAGPTLEERQERRLRDVGALAADMMPELESLTLTIDERGATLREQIDRRGVQAADLDGLRTVTSRLTALVRQLSGFSRRQAQASDTIDLATAVTDAEAVLARIAGGYATFSIRTSGTTPIAALRGDVDQLLTSLVTLGRDLLPSGGSLEVVTSQQAAMGSTGGHTFDMPGPLLSVIASGYGVQMPGTLASIDSLARRCGGEARATGDVGRSVRLDVIFPRCGRA